MKSCEIYVKNDEIYIICSSKTVPGFWISCEPMVKLSLSETAASLGKCIMEVINSSKQGVPIPEKPSEVTKALLRFIGFKSWKALEKGVILFLVRYDGSKIKFIPTRVASTRGFEHLPDKSVICDFKEEKIGQTIINLISVS